MKQKFLWRLVVVFLSLTFVFLPVSGQTGNISQERERYVLNPNPPAKTFPVMRPDDATIRRWQSRYERAPRAQIYEKYNNRANAKVVAQAGSLSIINLLYLLDYSPSENQGSCGNCWAWAGTRLMGIDLNTQKSTAVNFSVQFTNSCYGENACCGGWLSDIADFYSGKLMAIPKSNTNASFQDGNFSCSYYGNLSNVSCANIATSPHYPITSISEATITTTGVSQDTAISNIKNILNQGKAVWFAFYLPNDTAWNNFFNFWNNQSESALWDPDTYCGQAWDSNQGAGHAVTLVGYDDSSASTDDHYWIILNSWGTTANRPSGLFRMKMYANYGCTFPGLSAYALGFQTLNIGWGDGPVSDTTAPTITSFTIPASSTSLNVIINTFTATDDMGVTGYMVTESPETPLVSASGWSTTAPASYKFSSSTTSGTKTLYAWAKDAAGNISVSRSASVTLSIPLSDLIVSSVSNGSKTITSSSRTFSITDKTKNQGIASSTASVTKYYLSTTTSKTGSAILLSGSRFIAALAPGKVSKGSVTVGVPIGTARTIYYVIACADDNKSVSESNESNNCTVSSRRITVQY